MASRKLILLILLAIPVTLCLCASMPDDDEEEDADGSTSDNEDQQELNPSCEVASSCRDRKPTDSQVPRSCDCGPSCARHKTCCSDSKYRDVSLPSTLEECTWVESIGSSIFMVSKCDPAWNGTVMVKELCEGSKTALGDPVTVIPVINIFSGVTYGNIFCSMCNYEEKESTRWYFAISRRDYPDRSVYTGTAPRVITHRELVGWGYWLQSRERGAEFFRVRLHIKIPNTFKALVAQCITGIVSECADDWNDEDVRVRCKSYMAAVVIPREDKDDDFVVPVIYKNIDCALCNHQSNLLSDAPCSLMAKQEGLYTDDVMKKGTEEFFSYRLPDWECMTRFAKVGNVAILHLCRTVMCEHGYNVGLDDCIKKQ